MIYSNRLCYGCLMPMSGNHYGKICNNKLKCSVCHEFHPTCLHEDKPAVKDNINHQEAKSLAVRQRSNSNSAISLCIVPVYISHYDSPNKEKLVYALLDNDCTGCFCIESTLKDLAPKRLRKAIVSVETLNGRTERESSAIDGLIVRCSSKHAESYKSVDVHLPTTFSCDDLPLNRDDMPTPSTLKNWDHLKEVTTSMEEFNNDIPFALMIGGNCPKGLEPIQVVPSANSGPYAYRTLLGWCVVGPMDPSIASSNDAIKCNFVNLAATTRYDVNNVATGKIADHHFTNGCIARNNYLSKKLNEMYLTEFNEVNTEEKGMSQEDKRFLTILNSGIQKVNGNYEVPLPFRHNIITLPNNNVQATYRLQAIKKKMLQDSKYQTDYINFMESLIIKGHVRKCSQERVGDGNLPLMESTTLRSQRFVLFLTVAHDLKVGV